MRLPLSELIPAAGWEGLSGEQKAHTCVIACLQQSITTIDFRIACHSSAIESRARIGAETSTLDHVTLQAVQSAVSQTLDDGQEWRDAHRRICRLNEKVSTLFERTDLSEEERQQELKLLLRDYDKPDDS